MMEFLRQRVLRGVIRHANNRRIRQIALLVVRRARGAKGRPVVFFKASTGIDDLSWNSAFQLLAAWAFRLQGIPVVHFACHSGMSLCVLGTNRDEPKKAPPCRSCMYQSRVLYAGLPVSVNFESGGDDMRSRVDRTMDTKSSLHWFSFERDDELESKIIGMSLDDMIGLSHQGIPLGQMCLPSLRWILRRHNLEDDESTRHLMREYLLSGWNIAKRFSSFLDRTDPRAVVVFNGQFFPEAVAGYVARKRGLRLITHEVGLQPASAFFTDGEATAYPIQIPEKFELIEEQNERLDAYLQKRFQGQFSMAGIHFWPEIRGLGEDFFAKEKNFDQVVPVFTNVVFDTSQPHANLVFENMFAWLDLVVQMIKAYPKTLFVIRAHPDETRIRKASRETVQNWVEKNRLLELENVVFIAPEEYLSSYELIQRSKFVMVYNSTIGLEASIMGVPVLCSGKARFTQYETVFFPSTRDDQRKLMKDFLEVKSIDFPAEHRRNSRRFLYYQLFKTSLPFGDFLMPSVRATQARLKSFSLEKMMESPAIQTITQGILKDKDFLLED